MRFISGLPLNYELSHFLCKFKVFYCVLFSIH